jgi:UDP-3-O-[3-hydroxymyristoyl] glucosamine N-acyltransferase
MSEPIRFSIAELARLTNSQVDGDGSIMITSVAPIHTASAGAIAFLANQKYAQYLATSRASAVILDPQTPREHLTAIRNADPYFTFAAVVDLLHPYTPQTAVGIAKSTVIESGAEINSTARIGELCHIRAGSTIGADTELMSSVYVGKRVKIGKNCLIYPGVQILDDTIIGDRVIIHASTVLGSDGFGFAPSPKGHRKIKQIGWVEIGDDVELGSNVSIDRGTLGPTKIGRGTKIDNLVMIAHNVEVGEHCFIVAQVGIAGSTKVGNHVILAGQAGLIGHLEIGDNVIVAAQSGVSHSIPAGEKWLGSPAREAMQEKRREASVSRLPELVKRVKALEKKLGIDKE